MSTRSNIILVTPDNKVHQFYHHCDGYLSGVGEELRCKLAYSLGIHSLVKDMNLYDILVGEILKDEDYEDEYKHEMNGENYLHGDIEYLYVIKDSELFYVNVYECNLWKKLINKDLVDYVCSDNHKLDLSKRIHD